MVGSAQGPRPHLGPQTLPPPRRRAAGDRLRSALHLPGDSDQTLFVYRAPDGDTRSAEALKLLASWNAETTLDTRAATQPTHPPAVP